MGGMIAAGATSALTWICCGACNQCSEAKTGAVSRLPYIFMFFMASIFAILMSLYGEEEFGFKFYHTHVCQSDECSGNGSVFRVSLCLFIFEALHVMIVCKAKEFHHLFFPFKFIGFVIVLVCSFTISGLDGIFDEWGEIARFFSALYLLIQILIFVSWSYDLNEYLRIRGDQIYEYEEEHGYSHKCCCECIPGNCYHWTLGILSVGSLVAAFVCLGVFYPLYDQNNTNPHCAVHESVISITIILAGLTATASVVRGDGSFGVAAMICFYSTFLLFNALNADPDDVEPSCNMFHRARGGMSLWIGFLITFASLFYAALRSDMMAILGKDPNFANTVDDDQSSTNDRVVNLLSQSDKMAIPMKEDKLDSENPSLNDSNYNDVDETSTVRLIDDDEEVDPEEVERKANVYFHVVMMLASAYMAMLFTNWGTNKDSIDTTGTISFVVGVGSSWTAMLMYWWTICAPRLCPHRFPEYEEE